MLIGSDHYTQMKIMKKLEIALINMEEGIILIKVFLIITKTYLLKYLVSG